MSLEILIRIENVRKVFNNLTFKREVNPQTLQEFKKGFHPLEPLHDCTPGWVININLFFSVLFCLIRKIFYLVGIIFLFLCDLGSPIC